LVNFKEFKSVNGRNLQVGDYVLLKDDIPVKISKKIHSKNGYIFITIEGKRCLVDPDALIPCKKVLKIINFLLDTMMIFTLRWCHKGGSGYELSHN